jgi:hypothetical protein
MSYVTENARDRCVRIENFAADLTNAVYSIVLRRGLSDSWLKAELGLWRTLEDTLKKWARRKPLVESPQTLEAWRLGLLLDLTRTASQTAVENGAVGPRFELELYLYRAIYLLIEGYSRVKQSA